MEYYVSGKSLTQRKSLSYRREKSSERMPNRKLEKRKEKMKSEEIEGQLRRSSWQCLSYWWRDARLKPSEYFSCGLMEDNLFKWRVTILGRGGGVYDGGMFPCELTFPAEFPQMPPELRFMCPMWHPNIDSSTGEVCISILHPPGVDEQNPDERACERWLPVHTLETIVISVLSLLSDPAPESPLNVEAARQLRDDPEAFWRRVRRCTSESVDWC
jgi:ubiquitin-conjugating enzyme E2 G1